MHAPSFSTDDATIYAPASGVGRAAISVVRISGSSSDAALRALVAGDLPPDRVAALKTFRHPVTREELDRGLAIRFEAPRSFTGESMVELQITGGRAVLNAILTALSGISGLRPAEPGEFAWRAFENGKLDLSQVEGLADLVDAQTEAQRRQALRIAGGALSRQTETIREILLRAMALVEAQIDFTDQEDVDLLGLSDIRNLVTEAASAIRCTLATAASGERLREGFVVVIAGPPNVGKSTLMNALARRDVSIVSQIPGTTRDAIEVHLDLNGYPVTLVDTAGLRDSDDPIEREGVFRAHQRVKSADLTLWLTQTGEARSEGRSGTPRPHPEERPKGASRRTRAAAASLAAHPSRLFAAQRAPQDEGVENFRSNSEAESGRALLVRTKADLDEPAAGSAPRAGATLAISAKTGAGIAELLGAIAQHAEVALAGRGPALITLQRHRLAFEAALRPVEACLSREDGAVELIAEDLRTSSRALARISGRIDVEEVLGEIFSRLCIGK